MNDLQPAPYVYVASSWRNERQGLVCAALWGAGIEHYDFKNPAGGTGFSWKEVKTSEASAKRCAGCGDRIYFATYRDTPGSGWEPDYDPRSDPETWRHHGGYVMRAGHKALPVLAEKGSDWETAAEYLRMVNHPRAVKGFESDLAAMQRATHIVMVLPCGKSAHLELGWGAGAGKRTAVLLEDPVEPELMYRCADLLSTSLDEILQWVAS